MWRLLQSFRLWRKSRETIGPSVDTHATTGSNAFSMEGSQRRRINVSVILEGETMRFTWLDSRPDFEKQKGISHFACCGRRGHSRSVRHRFGVSSFGPGPAASTAEAAFLKEND